MDHASGIRPDGSQTATSPVTSGALIFRPGVASSGNAVATWAEVQKAITTIGALTVLVDDSTAPAVVPASGTLVTDCKSAVTLAPYSPKLGTPTQLEVADTAQLLNLAALDGVIVLLCDSVTVPSLSFSYSTPHVFEMTFSSTLRLKAGALLAPIAVPTGGEFFLSSDNAPTFDNSASASVPIVSLTGTAQFVHFAHAGFNFGSAPVTGAAGSTWSTSHDATVSTPPLGAFTGTFNETRLSFAAQTLPSQGATTGRPANPAIGQSYFDTTLGCNTWWNGVAWVASVTGRNVFAVSDVYINALTGNDENDGLTPSTAWATNGRLSEAVGIYGLISPPGTVPRWFTVNYLGAIPTDLLNLQAVLDTNACLRVLGTALKTVLHTGTITAATPYSNSNTLGSITDPGVTDWTPYINQRLTWLTGTAAGAVCFIAANLGGGQARIGNSGILEDIVLTNITFPRLVAPSTGTYNVESLPSLSLGLFDIQATNNGNFIEPAVNFVNLSLERAGVTGADPQPTGNGSVEFAFQGCVHKGDQFNGITFSACITAFPNGMEMRSGVWGVFSACVFNTTCIFIAGSTGTMLGYTLAEGCGFSSLQGSFLELENAAAENAVPVSFCNAAGDGATATCNAFSPGAISIRGSLVGSGNAGVGLRVARGHTIDCTVVPLITGTGGDFALDTLTSAYAWSDATVAYVATPVACTWPLIATAVTGSGFGGSAHDPRSNTHLICPNVGA